jgi:hypothetical protein
MDQWHLAETAVSAKGQKSCLLTANHQPVRFQLGSGLRTRFGASTFEKNVDAVRRSLDFDIDDADTLAKLREIDDWALDYITTHSERLLKKKLSRTEVENNYNPLVKIYGSSHSCKTKINIRGSKSATFWNTKNEQILEAPADGTWQDHAYTAFVSIPQLWIMAGSFGLLLETTALMLSAPSATNPFEQKAM